MSLSVVKISQTSPENWQKTWELCAWSSFFESPTWCSVWAEIELNAEACAFEVLYSDNLKVIFPGVITSRSGGLFKAFQAAPGGTYGGPICVSIISKEHILLGINTLTNLYSDLFYRTNPFLLHLLHKNDTSESPLFLSPKASNDFTQCIPLALPSDELNQKLTTNRIPAYARRTAEKGFVMRLAGLDDVTAFFKLYEESLGRWTQSRKVYKQAFFEALICCDGCDFWGCFTSDNSMVAGAIVCRGNEVVTSWLQLTDAKHLRERVAESLYHELICHYHEAGFKWFDFNPSAGLSGVVAFKEKFGSEKLPCPVLHESSFMYAFYDKSASYFRRLNV